MAGFTYLVCLGGAVESLCADPQGVGHLLLRAPGRLPGPGHYGRTSHQAPVLTPTRYI